MRPCVETGTRHADDGGCCDAGAATRNQPGIFASERFDFIDHVLSERYQCPATTVPVKRNLNFSCETKDIVFNAFGGLDLIKNKLRVQVQSATPEVRSFKSIRLGDAAGSTLYRIETITEVAMTAIH